MIVKIVEMVGTSGRKKERVAAIGTPPSSQLELSFFLFRLKVIPSFFNRKEQDVVNLIVTLFITSFHFRFLPLPVP